MITEFGKFTRKLRVEHEELTKDMAEKLGITNSYLSLIERGERPIPKDIEKKLAELYSLDELNIEILHKAISQSILSLSVDMKDYSGKDREIVTMFYTEFPKLTEEEKFRIFCILKRNEVSTG